MGHLDALLQAHVTTGLRPGEQVLGLGHVRQPQRFNKLGVPQLYVHWLAVATSSRIILFRTEAGGLFESAPKPVVEDSLVWEYDEIARVELGTVEGLNVHSGGQAVWLRLVPLPLAGPGLGDAIRYDVFPVAEGLDDQRRFMSSYPGWLAQQVAAGAFPMSAEKRAMMQARVAQRGAELAAQQQTEIARVRHQEEAIRRAMPTLVRVGVAVGLTAMFVLSAVVLVRAIELHAESSEALARKPNDEYEQEGLTKATLRMIGVGLGLVLAPSLGVVLFLLDRRRRKGA